MVLPVVSHLALSLVKMGAPVVIQMDFLVVVSTLVRKMVFVLALAVATVSLSLLVKIMKQRGVALPLLATVALRVRARDSLYQYDH